ncbi:hypothetical protein G4B88_023654 [Cannabis sativa]|uniref:Uncharacterized protein n=1 Tax=Cannabis sativa TaxID=3483 RepID=A0A7J6HXE6_CANSA|nr:hypothetical protein G4B88_023654 [Cannabis sativa]
MSVAGSVVFVPEWREEMVRRSKRANPRGVSMADYSEEDYNVSGDRQNEQPDEPDAFTDSSISLSQSQSDVNRFYCLEVKRCCFSTTAYDNLRHVASLLFIEEYQSKQSLYHDNSIESNFLTYYLTLLFVYRFEEIAKKICVDSRHEEQLTSISKFLKDMIILETISKFGSGLFILVQVVLLLDFVHRWNDTWVGYDERFWNSLFLGPRISGEHLRYWTGKRMSITLVKSFDSKTDPNFTNELHIRSSSLSSI